MSKELRVGFVGCGSHATLNLYPALAHAPVRLVAVCDTNEERRNRAKRLFGAEVACASYPELLQGHELDALLICGPPELHQEAATAALDAGLHVFVEKPPADTAGGAEEIALAAAQNGCQCMVGFMKRFALRYRQAHEIVESSTFGSLTQLTMHYAHWPCADLHDMLIYMTVHPLDLMRHFLGPLESMTIEKSETRKQYSFSAVVRAVSGAIGTLLTSSHVPHLKERLELVGEGEMVVVNNVVELEYHKRVDARQTFTHYLDDVALVRPDFAIPNPNQNTLFLQGYAPAIQEFADAVLNHRKPAVSIEDGVAAMRLAEIFENCPSSGAFDLSDWSDASGA